MSQHSRKFVYIKQRNIEFVLIVGQKIMKIILRAIAHFDQWVGKLNEFWGEFSFFMEIL